jgi:CheY-like chemotaxis protein
LAKDVLVDVMSTEIKNRILLVEDDADTRYALTLLFELEGFEVIPAGDGKEAYLLAASRHPDLIVTDINMPRTNGLELIRLIKRDGELAGVPIVAMSAIEKQQLNSALELGAIAAYQKPIEFDKFLSLIAKVIAARRVRSRSQPGVDRRRVNDKKKKELCN